MQTVDVSHGLQKGRHAPAGRAAWRGVWYCVCVVASSAVALGQAPVVPAPPSVASVEARLAAIDAATDVDTPTRTLVRDLYRQTLAELEETARWRAQALEMSGRVAMAPTAMAEAEATLEAPPAEPGISVTTLEETEQALARTRMDLQVATAHMVELDSEALRRTSRRATIRETLLQLEARGAEIAAGLDAPTAADEAEVITIARQTLLAARKMNVDGQTAALQQELLAYDAEATLLPRQRDLATRQVSQLDDRFSVLRARATTLRREDVSRQADAVREAADGRYARMLSDYVETNAALAERRLRLITSMEQAERRREATLARLRDLSDRATRTRERVEAIGQVPAIGLLLVNQRESLPDILQYRRQLDQHNAVARAVQAEMFDVDEQRRQLVDLDAAVSAAVANLDLGFELSEDGTEVVDALRRVLETQRTYVEQLLNDLGRYFDVLVEIGITDEQIVAETEAFLAFIDERILWIRSANRLAASDLPGAVDATRWMLDPTSWTRAATTVTRDLGSRPLLYGLSVVVFVAVLRQRRKLRQILVETGAAAAHHSAVHYAPTALALVLTLVIAGVIPGVLWITSWRLRAVADDVFLTAMAAGLGGVAVTFAPLEFLRQSCRRDGLMTAHFGWPERPVMLLRHHLHWVIPAVIPLTFLFVVMSAQDDFGRQSTLGRIALMTIMVLLVLLLQRLLRPQEGLFRETLEAYPNGWLSRLRYVWYLGGLSAPFVLATLAFLGYVYTAGLLVTRALSTLWLAVGVVVAVGMLSRWVRVNRGRLAAQQRRERIRAAMKDGIALGDAAVATQAEDSLPDIDLMDSQTRQLIRVGMTVAALAGVWLIWSEMIPAMGVLDEVTLWTLAGTEAGTTQPFTLEDLVMTLVLATLTTLAARNLPAAVEMGLLQRLPLQPGLRYAITTITRYLLGFIGILIIFGVLGVTWSSVQWLVAAFGVGLGFGLQEIFANFISGLILLFERPARVGDTVTIGDITGTVTRIRMRATTVLDWDMRELVVPNKDLVVGRLVNWTLSDSSNRITMAVGVAYGTDPSQVTRVLHEILDSERRVLSVPEAVVTFDQFGDSALRFTIRAYLSQLSDRLPVIHSLHSKIASRFKTEGIEIAFPQLDVHVRSTEPHQGADEGARALSLRR